jgi:predicted nuclease of restriction endonuclease-like (RecB) superfamily
VIERLAHDLRVAFPNIKGFSRANLMYMRAFAEAWREAAIVQQPVGQFVGQDAGEREIESAVMQHIARFLLELGAGFAFVGRQVHIEVGGDDFYIDLLFYHLKLRCYVVIELKTGPFKPEHTGQLSFYLSAVDDLFKSELDGSTIGLLLCKTQNRVVSEYALRDSNKPIGIAEYQLIEALPADLLTSLPTVEQIERELEDIP